MKRNYDYLYTQRELAQTGDPIAIDLFAYGAICRAQLDVGISRDPSSLPLPDVRSELGLYALGLGVMHRLATPASVMDSTLSETSQRTIVDAMADLYDQLPLAEGHLEWLASVAPPILPASELTAIHYVGDVFTQRYATPQRFVDPIDILENQPSHDVETTGPWSYRGRFHFPQGGRRFDNFGTEVLNNLSSWTATRTPRLASSQHSTSGLQDAWAATESLCCLLAPVAEDRWYRDS